MDFNFDTGTINGGLAVLDVTTLPPLGTGPANVLTIVGSGALTLPQGTAAVRPGAAGGTDLAGMFRYNTTVNQLEYFDSTTWQQLTSTAGTVSSFQTSLSGLTPNTATTGAITLAGTLGATSGGTGTAVAPTAGQFLYSAGGTTYSATTLSGIAVTTFSAGTTGLTPASPTSGAITLAGTLVLANGGTGASLTAVAGAPVYSTGSALALGTAGTTGQVYISGGTGAPTWLDKASTITTNQILQGNGSGAFTANGGTFVGSGSFSGVTLSGTVTNATDAVTKAYVDALVQGLDPKGSVRAATTGSLDLLTAFENGDTLDGVVLATGNRILIKNQIDGAINALDTLVGGSGYDVDGTYNNVPLTGGAGTGATANITIAGGVVTVVTLVNPGSGYADNDSLSASDASLGGRTGGAAFSTLVNTIANDADNGIYTVNASGAPTRALDLDSWLEVPGAFTFVEEGTTNADTGWVSTANQGGTLGTTAMPWVQFSGAGSYTAGNGLQLLGNQFSLVSPVSLANGGTNAANTGSNGSIMYNNGTSIVNSTVGTSGQILTSGGAGAPTWTTLSGAAVTSFQTSLSGLTPAVATTGAVTLAGTLGLASGGTNANLTAVNGGIVYSGAGALAISAAGTSGQILTSNGAAAPSWTTLSGVAVTTISFGTTGLTPNSATSGVVTVAGTLVVGNGGTGATTLTQNGVLFGNGTSAVGVTAAGTTGQVLVGNTGSAPTWATLSGAAVTSFQTSLSGLTPAVATTGAVTLAGTLGATSGGTGATVAPTAGQFLYSAAGTTYAATTLSGVAVTTFSGGTTGLTPSSPTSGAIVLAGTLALANGGTNASLTAVNGGSVYSTATGFGITAAGTTGQVLVSNGAAAPTWNSASTILQLYRENPSSPTTPLVAGTNAVAIGSGSSASGTSTFAVGDGTNASIFGSKSFANGSFATAGDAQAGLYVLRRITTTAAATVAFLDGETATQRLVVPNNSVWTFDMLITARRTDATGGGAGYRFVGVIRKDGTAGSTTFVGTPSKTVIGETNGAWDAAVTANTTDGDLRLTVTGEAAKTIRWVAVVRTTEVTN
jgi:hypothetical protein